MKNCKILHYNVNKLTNKKWLEDKIHFYQYDLDIGFIDSENQASDRFSILVGTPDGLKTFFYDQITSKPKVIQLDH